jgi:hypothetical protein
MRVKDSAAIYATNRQGHIWHYCGGARNSPDAVCVPIGRTYRLEAMATHARCDASVSRQKEMKGPMNKIRIILAIIASLFALSGFAQTPVPPHPLNYKCTGNGPDLQFSYDPSPYTAMLISLNQGTASTDKTAPVIKSVIYSGGADVTTGKVRIQPAANGAPFTITASDNVGVVYYHLYVDGQSGPQEQGFNGPFPDTFYVRWNAKTIAVGPHFFVLDIYDAAGLTTERTWTMTR